MTLEQSIAPDLLAFRINTIPYSIYVAYSLKFLNMSLHEGIWIPFLLDGIEALFVKYLDRRPLDQW